METMRRVLGAIAGGICWFWLVLKEVFFPSLCLSCHRVTLEQAFCPSCSLLVEVISDPICQICGYPHDPSTGSICEECKTRSPPWDSLRSAFTYDGSIRDAIIRFKDRGDIWVGVELGKLMVRRLGMGLEDAPDYVVPVGSSVGRNRERGYNPAAVLALEVSRELGVRVVMDLVGRVEGAKAQRGRSVGQRLAAESGTYFLNRKDIDLTGKSLLLIDDVATTTTTVRLCSLLLKEAGAEHVMVWSLARALMKN